ncbi:MAG: serine hydrolase [Opitutus sp.]|nr:serine hydrolase [Opitutus sp.]
MARAQDRPHRHARDFEDHLHAPGRHRRRDDPPGLPFVMKPSLLFATALLVNSVHADSPGLQQAVDAAVAATRAEFTAPELKAEQIAVTVVDLRGDGPRWAHHRGDERHYPASVIKLFYLAYAHHLLETGALSDSPELQRALRDMTVESYNDATATVVDHISGATGGPELPPAELAAWHDKRMAVTRWFEAQGYRNVLAVRKTWAEGPYGREKQDADANPPRRNFLSTNDTARLLLEIAQGRCVTPARSAQMLGLMERDLVKAAATGDADCEGVGFTGPALSPGMKLWSKAGWTSWTRHDAALIGLPGGRRVIIVTFTEATDHADNRQIIAAVARRVLASLP